MYCVRCKRYDYQIGDWMNDSQMWEALRDDGSTMLITIPYGGSWDGFTHNRNNGSVMGLCPECLLTQSQLENILRR
jgi:hypothetical protein